MKNLVFHGIVAHNDEQAAGHAKKGGPLSAGKIPAGRDKAQATKRRRQSAPAWLQ